MSAAATIPIARQDVEPPRQNDCGGCKHHLYSAQHGQAWNTKPHSRCTHFAADIPMLVSKSGRWYGNEIPTGCPTFDPPQKELAL